MKVLPAVDLREGACVQLVGGRYEDERVRLENPVGVARRWASLGFASLHVVDLDAATGRGENGGLVEALCRVPGVEVQVGGGVKSEERIGRLLDAGAQRVVVGTRAVEDRVWCENMAQRFPDRLVVAADVRGRQVVTRGWEKTLSLDFTTVLEALNPLPLAGVLVTAVHVEGKLEGPDLPLMAEAAQNSRAPLYASGGIATLEDLRALAKRRVFGVVIGMALYTGALDGALVAREFS
jgi:phosphoribosylformimino-5-aminoimidazole carboxamide ribotide isomerase